MPWFPLALSAAFFTAASDALTKRYLRPLGTFKMAVGRVLAPVLFLLPFLLFQQWPSLDPTFWKTLAVLLPMETLALVLYMEALRVSPLSLTVPFLAFTPAFMILTGAIILGERLDLKGIAGIFLIVAGSYSLHLKDLRSGFWAPFAAVFREKGSVLMLAVAFLYSVTSVLGKLAIMHSDPFFFAGFYFIVHGIFAATVLAVLFDVYPLQVVRQSPKGVFWVGIAQTVTVISHMVAISLAPAAYMIAVKRLSVLFGVLMGCLFFREEDLAGRLFGAGLMVAGVFLIVF